MTQNTKSISPLRQRMIDDMTMRKLSPQTRTAYIRAVKHFTRFFGRSPDEASAEDRRRFQLHMVSTGVSRTTINATITGLRFDEHRVTFKWKDDRAKQANRYKTISLDTPEFIHHASSRPSPSPTATAPTRDCSAVSPAPSC